MKRIQFLVLALGIVTCLACSTTGSMPMSTGDAQVVDPAEVQESAASRDLATRAMGSNRVEFRHVAIYDADIDSKDVTYPDQDEFVYVLSGQADVTIKGKTSRIGPGSFLFVPQGASYDFKMIEAPFEVLVAFSPPGE